MINKRSINMKRVSATRSAEVKAMLDLLRELDDGTAGDFGGFSEFKIEYTRGMKGRINSYRAQKIAKFLGKNISKSHLIKFSKDKHVLFERDKGVIKYESATPWNLTKLTIDEFIDKNKKGLLEYWTYSKVFYMTNALRELDNDTN